MLVCGAESKWVDTVEGMDALARMVVFAVIPLGYRNPHEPVGGCHILDKDMESMNTDSLHPRLSERVAAECGIPFQDEWREWDEWQVRLEMTALESWGMYKTPLFHLMAMGKSERQEYDAGQEKLKAWFDTFQEQPLEDGVEWFTTELVSNRLKLFCAYVQARFDDAKGEEE
jgi:hypothetical protein